MTTTPYTYTSTSTSTHTNTTYSCVCACACTCTFTCTCTGTGTVEGTLISSCVSMRVTRPGLRGVFLATWRVAQHGAQCIIEGLRLQQRQVRITLGLRWACPRCCARRVCL